jgi:hypothetical protein
MLLVGWDAADWKVIDPLMSKGEMPKTRERGRARQSRDYVSAAAAMLWTSIVAGKGGFASPRTFRLFNTPSHP